MASPAGSVFIADPRGPAAGAGSEGDNGFDTSIIKIAVSTRVSEPGASISRHRAHQFDHFEAEFDHFDYE